MRMIEIFDTIPEEIKKSTETIFNIALMQKSVSAAAKLLNNYVESCINDEEREFANFYFQMKFEELMKS